MEFDCLGAPGLFCVACTVSPDEVYADIAWSQPEVQGEQIKLKVPKQPNSDTYIILVPDDLASLHTEVIFKRVRTPLEDKN